MQSIPQDTPEALDMLKRKPPPPRVRALSGYLESIETRIKSTTNVHHAKSLKKITFEGEEFRILGLVSIISRMPRKWY
jgi:hypothetical protein